MQWEVVSQSRKTAASACAPPSHSELIRTSRRVLLAFIEPEMEEPSKALQRIPATQGERDSASLLRTQIFAFHETSGAAAATKLICTGQAVAAIAARTLASYVPDGREFDRRQ